ncbi:hypothetical protein FQI96_18240 [Escherichia coli]|nr:hypothetical protein [Escherichia coli]EFN4209865.1 hypothetical protein [Escherichia coli]
MYWTSDSITCRMYRGCVDGIAQGRIYNKRTSVPPNSLMKMSSESRKIFNFAVFLYLNSTISLFNDFILA